MIEQIKVLDHGYVQVVESWGSDERVIEAARMSTQKGFLGWKDVVVSASGETEVDADTYASVKKSIDTGGPPVEWRVYECNGFRWTSWDRIPTQPDEKHVCYHGSLPDSFYDERRVPFERVTGYRAGDERLLSFLWKNNHATPFEMGGLIIDVQAPIFVFREWHRHRTQSYNEMSARYAPLPDVNYAPSIERLMRNSKSNKQAGTVADAAELTESVAAQFCIDLRESYRAAESLYQRALANGVPKELARVHLPVGRYSRMRASANLRNWLAFITLRADSKAQWEIQEYARAVSSIVAEKFPRTHALWSEARP